MHRACHAAFRRTCLLSAIVIALASSADAHPFHVSLCEVERNERSGRLECALRVHPTDLERVLRMQEKRAVDLEKTPRVDEMITRYLQRHFKVSVLAGDDDQSDPRPCKLTWVGKEVTLKHAWLYFEIDAGEIKHDLQMQVGIFFEILDDQSNTVNFRDGRRRGSVVFQKDTRPQRVRFWSAPESDPS